MPTPYARPDGLTYFQGRSAAAAPLESAKLDGEFNALLTYLNALGTITQNISEWSIFDETPEYHSANEFHIPGDLRTYFPEYRMVRANLGTGYVYSAVVSSTYNAGTGKTTVALLDSVLTLALVDVAHAIINSDPDAFSLPQNFKNYLIKSLTAGAHTVTPHEMLFLCNCTGGNITPTLPACASVGVGKTYIFRKTDATTSTVIITPTGAETIDGVASVYTLSEQWQTVTLVNDGSGWQLIQDKLRDAVVSSLLDELNTFVLNTIDLSRFPSLTYDTAAKITVKATADSPGRVMMIGFPNILNPGTFIGGGLTDQDFRSVVADVSMDFAVAANLLGTEQVSQWYNILAVAADGVSTFTLKAFPVLRVKAQATQTISTGQNTTPANARAYGMTIHELIGSKIYILSGTHKGEIRTITENDEAAGATTITYSGTALSSLAQNDAFIILPDTNFCYLGDIYNNAAGNIVLWRSWRQGVSDILTETMAYFPPLWGGSAIIVAVGGGAGGDGSHSVNHYAGGGGATDIIDTPLTPGLFYAVTVGAGGAGGVYNGDGANGGTTSFAALVSAIGGVNVLGVGGTVTALNLLRISNQNGFDGELVTPKAGDSGFRLGIGGERVANQGQPGTGYGGGGCSSMSGTGNKSGGAGAPGVVKVLGR